MSFTTRDNKYTEQIKKWGRPHYKVWSFIAGHAMWLLLLTAALLVWQGRLNVLHAVLPLLMAYPLTLALQNIIARERPQYDTTDSYKLWYRTFSSPSAHALTSAAYATVLAFAPVGNTLEQALFVIGLGSLTLLIVVSRVIVGVHYFFDVLLGLLLGLLFGLGYIFVFSL